MELRHLRYFIAVAETGSLTLAAETRLHTAQPSLSRQIRDLEREVGAPLFNRTSRGAELTPAGRVFLDHARMSLAQAEMAVEAARQVAQPPKPVFSIGFLTGQEMDWLPHAPSLLTEELPKIEIRVSSGFSTNLAEDVQRGRLDVAFVRREPKPDLEFKLVTKEPFVVILPSDHKLTGNAAIDPGDLAGETFIGISEIAPVLRATIQAYLAQSKIEIRPTYEIDNFIMAMSLVTSTRGLAILPASVERWLPWAITSRPLAGEQPTIDLMLGYHRANPSPILKTFLSKVEAMATQLYKPRAKR